MDCTDQSPDPGCLKTAEAGAQEHPPAPSHLIGLKRLIDLKGRILEVLNQFRTGRSAYFSSPRASQKNHGNRVPSTLKANGTVHPTNTSVPFECAPPQ